MAVENERIERELLRNGSTDELLSGLEAAFNEFADPSQPFDDITLMAAIRLQSR